MKKILTGFVKMMAGAVGRHNLERALIWSAKAIDVNLHKHGLIQMGALSGFDHRVNGEAFLIDNVLKNIIPTSDKAILFDVGANVGDYAIALRSAYPHATIYAFEPVVNTYQLLVKNTAGHHINTCNFGLSDEKGVLDFYNTAGAENDQIASVYRDVFNGVFNNDGQLQSQSSSVDTIDDLCDDQCVDHIHHIKIDVEGHEYAVLKGAKKMLASGKVSVIQMEFNTHNLYSHVSLRDLYLLLSSYELYRLHPRGLVRLGKYDPVNEIYTAQNIVAVHQNVVAKLDHKYIFNYE